MQCWPEWAMDATDARRSPMMQPAPVREVWSLDLGHYLTVNEVREIVDSFRHAIASGDPHDPILVAVPLVRAELEIRLPTVGG